MLTHLAGPALLATSGAGVLATLVRSRPQTDGAPFRAALQRASVVLGLIVAGACELLSVGDGLTRLGLEVVWVGVLVVGWAVAFGQRHPAPNGSGALGTLSGERAVLVAVMTTFVVLTFVIAVVAPPNNWDAMTYHMPRVCHWLANHSIRHYPAVHVSQLFQPPFPGYAVATVQGLSESDRWSNLVQWFAYVGGAAAASLVVQRVGGSVRAQLLAALAFLTVPMAVLQASTTQADLVTAYWIVVLVGFASDEDSVANRLWLGATLGLGMLTKLTVAFYALPFMAGVGVRIARSEASLANRLRRTIATGVTIAAVALVLNFPHLHRTATTFGSPWGGTEVARNANEVVGPRSLISNVLRETVLHLPIPGYAGLVRLAHHLIGLDPDDPRTTHLFDETYTEVSANWFRPLFPSENSAGNPVHLVTAAALLVATLARGRRLGRTSRAALAVGAMAGGGWLLALAPLKWQPWSARFDLPFFALLAVPLGVGLDALPAIAGRALAAALVVGALPALLMAAFRPLVDLAAVAAVPAWVWLAGVAVAWLVLRLWGVRLAPPAVVVALMMALAMPLVARVVANTDRFKSIPPASILTAPEDEVLFRNVPELREPYTRAVRLVQDSGCTIVGLELRRDDWEYPLWRLFGAEAGAAPVRVRSFGVTNESAHREPEAPEPCAVISTLATSTLAGVPGWTEQPISAKPSVAVFIRRAGG